MKYSIGVDIGGTKTAIGIVDNTGEIAEYMKIKTDLSITPQDMIQRINYNIKKLIQDTSITLDNVIGIGIGAPGPLDIKAGLITTPPNLENWRNVPIVDLFKKEWKLPVKLENDANAAAVAEYWIGAGQGHENLVYMTISTGIGTGIIANGKLLRGRKGNGGEFGHTVIDPSYNKCACGQHGCFETIASGTAIARQASEVMGEAVSTEKAFELYDEGEPKIVRLMDGIIRVIGMGCVNIINIFEPEKVVIGGGVSKAGEALFNPIKDYVSQYALHVDARTTPIVPAKLDQNAGVIGAAALCYEFDSL